MYEEVTSSRTQSLHFLRPTFDVSKMLKVTFIPEGLVDDGGPR